MHRPAACWSAIDVLIVVFIATTLVAARGLSRVGWCSGLPTI
jgi:hypothetical protein